MLLAALLLMSTQVRLVSVASQNAFVEATRFVIATSRSEPGATERDPLSTRGRVKLVLPVLVVVLL